MALLKSKTIIVRTTDTIVKSSLHYQQRKEDAALSIGKSSLYYSKLDELLLKLMLLVGLKDYIRLSSAVVREDG